MKAKRLSEELASFVGSEGPEIITEGGYSWKVFNAETNDISKKRLFKYLTDNEPKGAGWTNLDEKTLEIDEPEKLDRMMGKSFSGYHCLFRCFGEDGGEKFKAWGYVFAGVAKTSNGVSVRPACT